MRKMKPAINILNEPLLEFGYGQLLQDPHDGLSMFGPFDLHESSHPSSISYAIIGTKDGVEAFANFGEAWQRPLLTPIRKTSHVTWPVFPGFEAAFHARWPKKPTLSAIIDDQKLDRASRQADPKIRAGKVVKLYLDFIQQLHKHDEPIHSIICVV